MKTPVTDQMSALAHERRLDVFRLLMRRYPDAVPAGEIASVLGLRPNTASVYLSSLRQAGLISQTRQGTFQLYQIKLDAVQNMFRKLLGDCCRNRPDICLPGMSAQPDLRMATERPKTVLFLCSHNSARSIMAEAMLRNTGDRFTAYSAGTEPTAEPHPLALSVLNRHGTPVDGLSSKPVGQYLNGAAPMDFVITVCDRAANEDVARWPGQPIHAHWGLADPLEQPSEDLRRAAMEDTFQALREKIDALVGLPLDMLDPASLQGQLDEIGRRHGALLHSDA